jgi:serine/threonine-protein kinase
MNLKASTAIACGKYVLGQRLGRGVFSLTYRATDTESGQRVAIKTLGKALRQHPEFDRFKQQFLDWAERLSHVRHPNLVPIRAWFEEAGCPYWVMEAISGQTLDVVIPASGLPEARALDYIRQIGGGVGCLHDAGLQHGDIKPQNIIRRQDSDKLVLCEFGTSCKLTPGTMQTHANLLSAGYAAPEQYACEGERGSATDIYALAATLHHLLTGRPPLPAPVRQTLHADENGDLLLPDLQQRSYRLSPAVRQAVGYGLELDPQKRPKTVADWLALLPRSEEKVAPAPLVASPTPEASRRANPTTSPAPKSVESPPPAPKPPRPFAPPAPRSQPVKPPSLLRALFVTGAIAASAGVGFGIALRLNHPNEPGSTILHTKQSFPPSSNWPVASPRSWDCCRRPDTLRSN